MKNFSLTTILGLTFGVLLAGYAVFAFDPPTVAPPGGNVEAPINVGADAQIKAGNLWLGGLVVQGALRLGQFSSLPPGCGIDPNKTGEIVFNTTVGKPYVCNGSVWQIFTAGVDNDGDGVTVPADCDDGNVNVWQNLTGYRDFDFDTYTTGGTQNVCSGNSLPSGWLSSQNGNDCNDGCSTCFPGSTITTFSADGLDQDCINGIDDITNESKSCSTAGIWANGGAITAACTDYCISQGLISGTMTCDLNFIHALERTNFDFNTCTDSNLLSNDSGNHWRCTGSQDIVCTCNAEYH